MSLCCIQAGLSHSRETGGSRRQRSRQVSRVWVGRRWRTLGVLTCPSPPAGTAGGGASAVGRRPLLEGVRPHAVSVETAPSASTGAEPARATARTTAVTFVVWATGRESWHTYVDVRGDTTYAATMLDVFRWMRSASTDLRADAVESD